MLRGEEVNANNPKTELSETASLVNENISATIGNLLEVEDSWYTPVRDAGVGFASGFGSAFGGVFALRAMDTPFFVPCTAIASTLGTVMCTGFGIPRDAIKNLRASDYVKLGLVGGVSILTSVGTMTGGAAITIVANITNPGIIAGVVVGASAATLITAPVAGLLSGLGLFKLRECMRNRNVENDITATMRPTLVVNT